MTPRKLTMNNASTATRAASHGPDLPALLALAAQGGRGPDPAASERAWATILRLYARRVFAMARAHVGSEEAAEEITQSVFATIATKLTGGEYAEQGRFESWLFRVTMNRVRDEARRRKRQATPTDPSSLADLRLAEGGEDGAADEGEIRALRAALQSLHDADREIVELRHHAALSFQQIADTLEQPLGTVLARHHRALKKLRTFLEEQDR